MRTRAYPTSRSPQGANTAKGTASLLVPLTSVIAASSGGWQSVFVTAAAMNLAAAVLALLVLKPVRNRMRATVAGHS